MTIRTVFLVIFFWTSLLLAALLLPVVFLLSIPSLRPRRDRFLAGIKKRWSRILCAVAGVRIIVTGSENIPTHNSYCCLANHQSYIDIVVILGWVSGAIGFIAKKGIDRVPVLGFFAKIGGSAFINRKNFSSAIKVVRARLKRCLRGEPLLIFPEGTRSRCNRVAPFKESVVKMVLEADCVIVPVTISGTYRGYEKNKRLRSTEVFLTVHPPIDGKNYERSQAKELNRIIHEQITAKLHHFIDEKE